MKVVLTRFIFGEVQIIGELDVITWDAKLGRDDILFKCKTLELPNLDNQQNISCIPRGTYTVRRHISPTFHECFNVCDVPGRTHILIHAGNFYTDIKGCILVGEVFLDITDDGNIDVVKSKRSLKALLRILPTEFEMEVI